MAYPKSGSIFCGLEDMNLMWRDRNTRFASYSGSSSTASGPLMEMTPESAIAARARGMDSTNLEADNSLYHMGHPALRRLAGQCHQMVDG